MYEGAVDTFLICSFSWFLLCAAYTAAVSPALTPHCTSPFLVFEHNTFRQCASVHTNGLIHTHFKNFAILYNGPLNNGLILGTNTQIITNCFEVCTSWYKIFNYYLIIVNILPYTSESYIFAIYYFLCVLPTVILV